MQKITFHYFLIVLFGINYCADIYAQIQLPVNATNQQFMSIGYTKPIIYNNELYFNAKDAVYGEELWKTDGVTTTLVKDINPGSADGYPTWFTLFNNEIYFVAKSAANGAEVWKTDGTTTVRVTDIGSGAADGVWIGGSSEMRFYFVEYNGYLYFNGKSGSNWALWRTNGISTTQVATGIDYIYEPGCVFNNKLYFHSNSGSLGYELYSYNGSTVQLVQDISIGTSGSYPGYMTVFKNRMVFRAGTTALGTELYQVDSAGIVSLVIDFNPGTESGLSYIDAIINGKLYSHGTFAPNDYGIWNTDLDTSKLLKDFFPMPGTLPRYFLPVSNTEFYLSVRDFYGRDQLWKSNGDSTGTTFVMELNQMGQGDQFVGEMVLYQNKIYFVADTGTYGSELWLLDTIPTFVTDINPGSSGSSIRNFTEMNGSLYFIAYSNSTSDIWKIEGCDMGTITVSNDSICHTDSTTLSIVDYDTSLTITWQEFDGSNWINSVGFGSDSSIYKVAPSSTTKYRVKVDCTSGTQYTTEVEVVVLVTDSADAVNGPANVCIGDSAVTYSVPVIINATDYLWQVPPGVTIISGVNTHSIKVYYTDTALSGNFNVKGFNICDTGAVSTDLYVQVNTKPSVTFTTPLPSLCGNEAPITLPQGMPSGGTFSGTGVNASNFDPNQAGAGIFTITYSFTDTNGCTSSAIQPITVYPVYIINETAEICQNDSILIAGAYRKVAGTYYDTLVTTNGCDSIIATTLAVNSLPYLIITDPATACFPGTVNITNTYFDLNPVPGTVTYWMDSAAIMPLAVPSAIDTNGTYYIKKTTINGCSDIKPVLVVINTPPALNIVNPAAVCAPSTVDITTTFVDSNNTNGTVSYWVNSSATISVATPTNVSTSGTYYIKKTTTDGCSDIEPVIVTINAQPTVTYIQNPVTICINNIPITLSPGSPAGGTYSGTGVTGNMFDPSVAGVGTFNIIYTYTNSNNCSNSVAQNITVSPCTGIESIVTDKGITIFPNPFSNTITIEGIGESSEVTMYNVLGDQIGHWRIKAGDSALRTEQIPAGVYFLQIKTEKGFITKRMVKE